MTTARAALQAAQDRLEAKRRGLGLATRQEHAKNATRRRGRWVRCAGGDDVVPEGDHLQPMLEAPAWPSCGYVGRVNTWRGRRLRDFPCPECGGRLRPKNWGGFLL